MWAGMPSAALESSRSRCRLTAGSAWGTSTISALRGPGLATGRLRGVVGGGGPGGDLAARGVAELAQDVGHMTGGGGRADEQLPGDVLVAGALDDQGHDLALTGGERTGAAGAGTLLATGLVAVGRRGLQRGKGQLSGVTAGHDQAAGPQGGHHALAQRG